MNARAGLFETPGGARATALLGVWVFLATELMFFGPLFLAYAYGRVQFPAGFAAASREAHVFIGTANTALLLTSSVFVAGAVRLAEAGHRRPVGVLLWLAAVLGLAFLALKAREYGLEWQEQRVPWLPFRFDTGPAQEARYFYWLYFAMTGLHALHLLIGIVLVGVFAMRLERSREVRATSLAAAGLYWHFVDAVWVFLYPLIYLVGRHG